MDSGMIVVILISMGYLVMVFGLLFYVKNEWCELLFKNMTVIVIMLMFITNAEYCAGEYCLQALQEELQEGWHSGRERGASDWAGEPIV